MTVSLRRVRSLLQIHFNPHEREARDPISPHYEVLSVTILIHTSVKLVTDFRLFAHGRGAILIHTSVKLVTNVMVDPFFPLIF